jgi:hypothetical protein
MTRLSMILLAITLVSCSDVPSSNSVRSELMAPLSDKVAPGGKAAAMAVVRREGARYWGFSVAPSEKQAASQAIAQCTDPRCVVVSTWTTGQCPIVVLGRTQIFWSEEDGDNLDEVMSVCEAITERCEIKHELCL